MILKETRKTRQLVTFVYSSDVVCCFSSAADFLLRAARAEGFTPVSFALRDLSRSADEGNRSREWGPNVSREEMLDAFAKDGGDRLYLAGRFGRANTGIGVDLKSWEIAVTLSRRCAGKIDALIANIA